MADKVMEEDSISQYWLSGDQLLELRKPPENLVLQTIGDKMYLPDKDDMEDVKSLLEDKQRLLEQHRASKIGDLIQAEWNADLHKAVTKKLKGKFTQHMGKWDNNRTHFTLCPEETVFLLENGSLELQYDGMPLSTEEAYAVVLTGKLALEKYQVYSYLSRLGYLVVLHQDKVSNIPCERRIHPERNKIKVKRKRKNSDSSRKKVVLAEEIRKDIPIIESNKIPMEVESVSNTEVIAKSSIFADSVEENRNFVSNNGDISSNIDTDNSNMECVSNIEGESANFSIENKSYVNSSTDEDKSVPATKNTSVLCDNKMETDELSIPTTTDSSLNAEDSNNSNTKSVSRTEASIAESTEKSGDLSSGKECAISTKRNIVPSQADVPPNIAKPSSVDNRNSDSLQSDNVDVLNKVESSKGSTPLDNSTSLDDSNAEVSQNVEPVIHRGTDLSSSEGIVEDKNISSVTKVGKPVPNENLKYINEEVLQSCKDDQHSQDKDTESPQVKEAESLHIEGIESSQVKDTTSSPVKDAKSSLVKHGMASQVKVIVYSQVKDIEISQVKDIEISQVNDVEPSQVNDVEPPQVNDVEPSQVNDVEPSQVNDVEPSQVKDVEPSQVKDVEPSQMKDIEPSQMKDIETSQVNDVEPSQVKDVNSSQVKDNECSQRNINSEIDISEEVTSDEDSDVLCIDETSGSEDDSNADDSMSIDDTIENGDSIQSLPGIDTGNDTCESIVEEVTDVQIVQVTRKESKPLAVIDLLSDEEGNQGDQVCEDDDIQIIDDFSKNRAASGKSRIKSEQPSVSVKTDSSYDANVKWPFPHMIKKAVVCLPRPPPHLLPPNVRLNKEAYTIDLKQLSGGGAESGPPRRVWNSFRDLQERRRQNFHTGPLRPFSQSPPVGSERKFSSDMGYGFNPRNSPQPFSPQQNQFNACPPMISGDIMHRGSPLPLPLPTPTPNNEMADYLVRAQHMAVQAAQNILSTLTQNLNVHLGGMQTSPFLPNRITPQGFQNVEDSKQNVFPGNNRSGSPWAPGGHNMPGGNGQPMFPGSPQFAGRDNHFGLGLNMGGQPDYNRLPFRNGSSWQNDFGSRFPQVDHRREEHQGNPFPSDIPKLTFHASSWREFKSVAGDDVDVEQTDDMLPLNVHEILWTKAVTPLLKHGSDHNPSDIMTALQITKNVNVCMPNVVNEKYLQPNVNLEISFDIYLPGSVYRKTCPAVPDHRVVIVRFNDQFPKFSEVVALKKKFKDSALLQFAVVDNGDIAFFSFNHVNLPILSHDH